MRQVSDKTAFTLIGCVSLGVLAFLYWLLYVHVPVGTAAPAWVTSLPALNACLNASSAVCLLCGFYFILKGDRVVHRRFMLSALGFTAVFLVSYISYHHFMGSTKFGGQGWIRPLYFTVLISHIFLSAVVLPLSLIILFFALTARFATHKKIARVTFPIWLYVSVSGVAVYFLLNPYR
ncbi:MAG: DUF420 domain-containing protein [candidate division FCPU426 bacterium]